MLFTTQQLENIHQETFAYLQVKEENHVLYLTLNRPEKRNAMNEIVLRELAFALTYAKQAASVWVVVLAANGDTFCAGADLKTFLGHKDEDSGSTIPEEQDKIIIGNLFDDLYKPCIAKVNRPVYAGGFLLLGGCTHVVATDSVTFTLSEVKRGIWPFQVMASMLKIMPERQVLNWCMEGAVKQATEAHSLGLVTHLTTDEELDEIVETLVKKLRENAPTAIQLGLEAAAALKQVTPNQEHQFLHKKLMECIQSENAQEGMRAFKEKRKPKWK